MDMNERTKKTKREASRSKVKLSSTTRLEWKRVRESRKVGARSDNRAAGGKFQSIASENCLWRCEHDPHFPISHFRTRPRGRNFRCTHKSTSRLMSTPNEPWARAVGNRKRRDFRLIDRHVRVRNVEGGCL